jgi:hypothetical protein
LKGFVLTFKKQPCTRLSVKPSGEKKFPQNL